MSHLGLHILVINVRATHEHHAEARKRGLFSTLINLLGDWSRNVTDHEVGDEPMEAGRSLAEGG
jgi:hypothetical protein